MNLIDTSTVFMLIGFFAASYSVIANDSVQTLGTFIASNNKIKWYWLWTGASAILWATIIYAFIFNNGDISFGRLNKVQVIETFQWYHALVPLILVVLTRLGIPVSTTFLILSVFATSVVLEKMLIKSVIGYGLAAIVAFTIWSVLPYILNEHKKVGKKNNFRWQLVQWITTGFLWSMWLSHDLANIAVFMPRKLTVEWAILSLIVLTTGLGFIFWRRGGKIQEIVLEKTTTRYVRSATIIDAIYAFILLFFKEYNDIPMSTTWVFIGILCGRELALTYHHDKSNIKKVWPLIGKDFLKMMVGLGVSIAMVLLTHYVSNDHF